MYGASGAKRRCSNQTGSLGVSRRIAPLRSQRLKHWLPWAAGLAFVAAVVAVLVLVVPNTGGRTNVAPDPNGPPADLVAKVKNRKTIPLEARRVAGTFVLTAAMRKNLDEAWRLAGPEVRQGMSYKQWLTGNIAVAPVFGGIESAPMSVNRATDDSATLQIIVKPKAAGAKPAIYSMRLDRIGNGKAKHWVVNEFQQWASVAIPSDPTRS